MPALRQATNNRLKRNELKSVDKKVVKSSSGTTNPANGRRTGAGLNRLDQTPKESHTPQHIGRKYAYANGGGDVQQFASICKLHIAHCTDWI
jgi:hypothetical protein